MRLAELLSDRALPAGGDVHITDLTLDSREVRPGAAFLACGGKRSHGLRFLDEALSRGARAILWEPGADVPPPPGVPPGVFMAAVPGLRGLAGGMADRFFGAPSRELTIAGITGTNGKTTSACVLAQALARCGRPAAYFGTLGFGAPGPDGQLLLQHTAHTTPDVITVHRRLREAQERGLLAVAMEISSHALDQGRVDGVRLHTAVFTNLSRDHLDYHGTMDAYGAVKASLFERPELAACVVNVDDGFGAQLAARLAQSIARGTSAARLVLASRAQRPESPHAEFVLASRIEAQPGYLGLDLETSWGQGRLRAPFIGIFNAENLLAVLGVLLSWHVPLPDAIHALSQCTSPPGRMQMLGGDALPLCIVDYAHSPDALAKAIAAVREHRAGRLWCVFGCGGDRDRGKREQMGRVADQFADEIILTDDNPRSESPQQIVADIMHGISRRTAAVVHDRGAAIEIAVMEAAPADAVLIAGKGHEDYQIVGQEHRAFSDLQAAQLALTARAARLGGGADARGAA